MAGYVFCCPNPAPPPLSLSLSKAPLYGQRGRGSFDFAG